jgi:hypothetical protein
MRRCRSLLASRRRGGGLDEARRAHRDRGRDDLRRKLDSRAGRRAGVICRSHFPFIGGGVARVLARAL